MGANVPRSRRTWSKRIAIDEITPVRFFEIALATVGYGSRYAPRRACVHSGASFERQRSLCLSARLLNAVPHLPATHAYAADAHWRIVPYIGHWQPIAAAAVAEGITVAAAVMPAAQQPVEIPRAAAARRDTLVRNPPRRFSTAHDRFWR